MRLILLHLLLIALCLYAVGCDENDPYFPAIEVTVTASPGADGNYEPHGTIRVSPSPFPEIEIQFRENEELPSPTPVDL